MRGRVFVGHKSQTLEPDLGQDLVGDYVLVVVWGIIVGCRLFIHVPPDCMKGLFRNSFVIGERCEVVKNGQIIYYFLLLTLLGQEIIPFPVVGNPQLHRTQHKGLVRIPVLRQALANTLAHIAFGKAPDVFQKDPLGFGFGFVQQPANALEAVAPIIFLVQTLLAAAFSVGRKGLARRRHGPQVGSTGGHVAGPELLDELGTNFVRATTTLIPVVVQKIMPVNVVGVERNIVSTTALEDEGSFWRLFVAVE
mmetsp:Transcript_24148/g.27523  ORF Transcript_24148/g.27523 Transcript_24148/m.27523 type:complete len:251 (+) Transcript_24148:361-1113(+)